MAWIESGSNYSISLFAGEGYLLVVDQGFQRLARFPDSPGTSIAANGFLVVAVEKDPGWQFPTLTGLPFSLNDKGDAVRLSIPTTG
jgi:hypothetical protein